MRAELRRVLDEIQEILRTLDQAEREKTATEDEIEMLRESLRGLRHEPSYGRHRGESRSGSGYGQRSAPAPAAPVKEVAAEVEEAEQEEQGEAPENEDRDAEQS